MRYVLNPDIEARAGRVGDFVTFMRNGRALSRRYVHPANPKSSPQLNSRSLLVLASAVWATCSDTQRAGWQSVAETYYADKVDSLGNPAPWSGQMLCTATHVHRFASNNIVYKDAYTGSIYSTPVGLQSIYESSGHTITGTHVTTPSADGYVRLRVSGAMIDDDYAPNGTKLRSIVLPQYSSWGYCHNTISLTSEWSLGSSGEYASDLYNTLVNDDIICTEVLWLGDTFMPSPSGPVRNVIPIGIL